MTDDPNRTQQDDQDGPDETPERRDNLTGKTFGQFEIMEEIGRGGMATVYRARQKSIDRTVAVKVLPPSLLHDPGFFERFEREVNVISHLEHPHILPIYDYGQEGGVPYIAMRYLGGGSMEHFARKRRRPIETLERPLRQITQALDYAHRQGIIHRDLKPANIMMDEEGNAYLSDFGIARVLGSELTGSMIIGTPSYMSPEQAAGDHIDSRSDVYALGVVLFELITGKTPYNAPTPMAVLLKHIKEPLPDIRALRADCPPAIEQVIQIATAKTPDHRFASAGELAKSFSAALRGDTAQFDRSTLNVGGDQAQQVKGELNAMLDTTGATGPSDTTESPVATGSPGGPQATVQFDDVDAVTGDPTLVDDSQFVPDSPTQAVAGTGAVTPEPTAETGRRARSLIVFGVLLGAVAVVAIVGLLMSGGSAENAGSPGIAEEPTAFIRSERVQMPGYRVSVPTEWQTGQAVGGAFDISTPEREIYVWQTNNGDMYVAVTRYDYGLDGGESAFMEAVADFQTRFIDTAPTYTSLIDEATAEDGSIRRSYVFDGENPQGFGPGQIDVYYLERAPYLFVFQMYTSANSGNTHVPNMQAMLDSLWVEAADT